MSKLPLGLKFEISKIPEEHNGLNCNCNQELDIFGIKDDFEQDTFRIYSGKQRKSLFMQCVKCGLVQELVMKKMTKKITKIMKK